MSPQFLFTLFISFYSARVYYYDFISFRLFSGDLANPEHHEIFDFIVVGAGTAGSVLANRLSKHHRVLLLEAGGNPHPVTNVPMFAPFQLNHPWTDWMHETVPQTNCCRGFENSVVPWPRGKFLGGTSNLNFMVYMRGHPKDFDNWANLTGDKGWLYVNLVPYFKKFEDYHGNYPNGNGHAISGPLHNEKIGMDVGLEYLLNAAKELGYNSVDMNDHQTEGFSPFDVTMKHGSRFGSYKAYLEPILNRDNLNIHPYSHATKIHINTRKRAYGVSYIRHGVQKFAHATKEVILSAGSIESPRLLMLSGIGPKEHLESVGIKCKSDLPVGQNLQDHVFSPIGPFVLNDTVSFVPDRDFNFDSIQEYRENGTGPLSFGGLNGIGILSTEAVRAIKSKWPNLLLHFIPLGMGKSVAEDMSNAYGLKYQVMVDYLVPLIGKDCFQIAVAVGRPRSRGEIRLKDANPTSTLHIDPKYLDNEEDIRSLLDGVNFVRNLFQNTKTAQKIGAKLTEIKFPGCEEFVTDNDDYWRCYVTTHTMTNFHPASTCPMGKASGDPTAVLDSQLRVLGISGLRVIDASVMPTITNANINAPTIMIGEKGADLIREYYSQHFAVCDSFDYYFLSGSGRFDKCYYFKYT